jgi:hypothetical protein
MNKPFAFAALVATSLAAPAWAESPTPEPAPTASTLTRAEVQAEYAAFKKAGVDPWSSKYNPLRHTVGTKSRAEVQEDLARFKSAGADPWSSKYNPLRHAASTKNRADVANEYVVARDEVHAITSESSGSGWVASAPAPSSTQVAARHVKAQ